MQAETTGLASADLSMFANLRSAAIPSRFCGTWFAYSKRSVDLVFSVLVIPQMLVFSLLLFVVNPIWNPGPVFFRQRRMGQGGRPFVMWKFRTMTENGEGLRGADAPLDAHRITPLGRILRRTKLDELPNVLNVFMGEMSLVGPRPDAFDHAAEYLSRVPHYDQRFVVRPGITGLAQVRGGYADNPRAVERKARYDKFYIRNASWLLDLRIISMTFGVVLSGFGQQ